MARAEQANQDDNVVTEEWTPQINLGISVLIPETYVADLGLRLNLYRRLAHLGDRSSIDEFAAELIDRFGALPIEVKNLLVLIELKGLCRRAHIEKLDAGPKGLVIGFRHNHFPNHGALMTYLQSPETLRGGPTKIRPDQKLVFMREWVSDQSRLKGVLSIMQSLAALL